jgi:hypothetical protein
LIWPKRGFTGQLKIGGADRIPPEKELLRFAASCEAMDAGVRRSVTAFNVSARDEQSRSMKSSVPGSLLDRA